MSDLIRREDAYAAIRGLTRHIDRIAAITALPAVQADAYAVWNAAIREAAGAAWAVEDGDRWTRSAAQDAILALLDKPKGD